MRQMYKNEIQMYAEAVSLMFFCKKGVFKSSTVLLKERDSSTGVFLWTLLIMLGRSETCQNVLEKNRRGGLRRICKTLFGTEAMNQAKLVI